MRVLFLNGNPHQETALLDEYILCLKKMLEDKGHHVESLLLRDMNIRYCTGCFGCWIKTPGECVAKDDSAAVCRAFIQSDLVVFASPVMMGFTSALLKKAHDKIIPLIHPYIEVQHGECHHRARYDKYPQMAVLLKLSPDTDEEDLAIISEIYRRDTINFHSSLAFFKDTRETAEEVAYAISNL